MWPVCMDNIVTFYLGEGRERWQICPEMHARICKVSKNYKFQLKCAKKVCYKTCKKKAKFTIKTGKFSKFADNDKILKNTYFNKGLRKWQNVQIIFHPVPATKTDNYAV